MFIIVFVFFFFDQEEHAFVRQYILVNNYESVTRNVCEENVNDSEPVETVY